MTSGAGQSDSLSPVGAALTHWDGASEATLAQALAMPATDCFEAEAVIGQQPVSSGDCRAHLALTVTTRSAYRLPIVKAFLQALKVRISLSEDTSERIQIAVQETFMNAVLHGNLKVDPGLRTSFEALELLHRNVETSLASPSIARLAVGLESTWSEKHVHVVVRDSGDGFVFPPDARETTSHRASGRGLGILDLVCERFEFLDGGRAVRLDFLR